MGFIAKHSSVQYLYFREQNTVICEENSILGPYGQGYNFLISTVFLQKKRFLFFITSSIVKPDSIHCMEHEKWFQNCAFLNDLSRGFLGNKYFSLQIITDWILLIITFFVRFFISMFSFIFLRCFPNKAWKSEQAASIICSFFSLKTVRFKFHIVQNDRAKIFYFFARKIIYYI